MYECVYSTPVSPTLAQIKKVPETGNLFLSYVYISVMESTTVYVYI